MSFDPSAIVRELDELISEWTELRARATESDYSDYPDESAALSIKLAAAIQRHAPPGSPYRDYGELKHPHLSMQRLPGHIVALRDDYAKGRMLSVFELLHADMFSDFLDMAMHLWEEGYKDPAAVLAGATLEEHLRKLCVKHTVVLTDQHGKPKKAAALNIDLRKAAAYSGLDEKSVSAWQALRNDAAHGSHAAYTADQVKLMIAGVRNFLARHPA